MTEYLDKYGDHSITHYQIVDENIIVWFRGRKAYSYSYDGGAGEEHVENMKIRVPNMLFGSNSASIPVSNTRSRRSKY